MIPCQKCLENKWHREFVDGWVTAYCLMCGYEVEFPTGKLKRKLLNEQKAIRENKRVDKNGISRDNKDVKRSVFPKGYWANG